MNYFEVGVRYDKTHEDGVTRPVTETFLTEGVSFSDAEATTISRMSPCTNGDIAVVKMKLSNISEVVTENDDAEKFYKVKYNIITLNENTGKEKKQAQYILFCAHSVDDARKRFHSHMQGSVCDCELEAIVETKFVDFFAYGND